MNLEDDFIPLTLIPTNLIPNKLSYFVYKKNASLDIDNFNFASVMIEFNNKNVDEIEALVSNSSSDELLFERFNYYSSRIGKIVRLSEIINYDVETIIRIYLQERTLKDVTGRRSRYKELSVYENTYRFDFTKFSKLLSCIINSDSNFEIIEKLDSKEKRKVFTRRLNNFIKNRNYYTHGYLFIRIPSYEPLISVVCENSDHHIHINDDIIKNDFETFLNLKTIMDDITKVCSGTFKNSNNP